MKLENQVCTIEQAKKLKELGVIASAIWYWVFPAKEKMLSTTYGLYYHEQASDIVSDNDGDEFDHASASAYGVAEFGVMLPQTIKYAKTQKASIQFSRFNAFTIYYNRHSSGMNVHMKEKLIEAHARAEMLICLLENGHVTAEEINQRLQNS